MKSCMFTGHRPQSLPFGFNEGDARCAALKTALEGLILRRFDEGVRCFITGMALGVDTFAAEAVLALRAREPSVSLVAVLPCRGQTARWSAPAVERYGQILHAADRVLLLQEEYTPDCMMRRNRGMVEMADACIAVWNGRPGGTGATVGMVRKKGLPLLLLHPETLSVTEEREAR